MLSSHNSLDLSTYGAARTYRTNTVPSHSVFGSMMCGACSKIIESRGFHFENLIFYRLVYQEPPVRAFLSDLSLFSYALVNLLFKSRIFSFTSR
jgi:hypothetical protein